MPSTISPTHPLYHHHLAASRIQQAFRRWRQRVRDRRLRDMYRVVDQEAEMRRQLAQLDAKMAHRLAVLDAKAKTFGSKLPLTRVDAERVAVVRLQRWWRQVMKERSKAGRHDEDRWASARRSKWGHGNAAGPHVEIPDHPDSHWIERFSSLDSSLTSAGEQPMLTKMRSVEQHPPDLSRIRELRRMYTAQQRIDERLPDPSGAESVVERTVATFVGRVRDDLQPRWIEDGRNVSASCAKIQGELHSSACRLAAANTLIQSIQEKIADIERLSCSDSPSNDPIPQS